MPNVFINFFSGNEIIYSDGESDSDEDYEPIAKKTKKPSPKSKNM